MRPLVFCAVNNLVFLFLWPLMSSIHNAIVLSALMYKRIILQSSVPLKWIALVLLWAVARCYSKDMLVIMCERLFTPAKENEWVLHLFWTVADLDSEPQASETLASQGTKTMSFMFWGQLAAGHISRHGNCQPRLGSGRRMRILGCHPLVVWEGTRACLLWPRWGIY